MNKKLAHTFFFFFDLLCIEGIWYGFHEFQRILMETTIQADIIRLSNRVGFFILVILIPAIHLLAFVDRVWPNLPRKYSALVNKCIAASVIILLSLEFISSSWIKTQVENAGYYYCRGASGAGALSRTLVYTRNAAICEDLAAAKIDRRK